MNTDTKAPHLMRPIPGTITDPRMDRIIPHATRLQGFETPEFYDPLSDASFPPPATMDGYQEAAAEFAVYPRVYTEDQIKDMLYEALCGNMSDLAVERQTESLLDRYETPFNRLVYPLMGLAGEVGEILNKAKKIARDDQGQMDLAAIEDISKELGDSAWYLAAIATELRTKLGDVARANIAKLKSRKERGVLGGSGDNR